MKRNSYKRDSTNYLQRFKEAREDRAKRLSRLPFAQKVDIIERMRADAPLGRHT
jgi:hypothetical protein